VLYVESLDCIVKSHLMVLGMTITAVSIGEMLLSGIIKSNISICGLIKKIQEN